MDLGWKKKAERLRMTILSAGHQPARALPVGICRILELFRRTAETGDGSTLQQEMSQISPDSETPLWEPLEVYGWRIQATLYRDNSQLWWLLHAVRKDECPPSEGDTRLLGKVLDHLGADPTRDMIIGPSSSPTGEPPLPFGWWRWFNRWPLYEVQVRGKGKSAVMRVVPIDTPESDGYVRVDMHKEPSACPR